MEPTEDDDPGWKTEYDGYSDYQFVSRRMGKSIDEAIDAFAMIDAMHREDAMIQPNQAANARKKILGAAMRVLVEMENQDDDKFEEIVTRWTGDDGLLDRLKETQLQYENPDWLFQLVRDVRTAAWKLGYLQAGRTERKRTDPSPEGEAQEMFSEL